MYKRQRFDNAQPEGFIEVDQMQQGHGAPQKGAFLCRAYRTDILDLLIIQVRSDELIKIIMVLDNPSDDQRQADLPGQLDCFSSALIRVNPPEEEQVAPRLAGEGILFQGCLLYTS